MKFNARSGLIGAVCGVAFTLAVKEDLKAIDDMLDLHIPEDATPSEQYKEVARQLNDNIAEKGDVISVQVINETKGDTVAYQHVPLMKP